MVSLSVSERVVEAVAEATDTDPMELPPLHDTLDSDALDALIPSMANGELSFDYAGCSITVNNKAAVQIVHPLQAD